MFTNGSGSRTSSLLLLPLNYLDSKHLCESFYYIFTFHSANFPCNFFFFFLLLSVMFPPLFPNNTTENQLWLFSQRKLAFHSLCLLGPLWGYIYIFLSFEKHFLLLLFFILFLWMFFFFLISWRLITLQYCSGFCHTLTWISLGYTCIPHNSFTWFISFSREELILYVPNGSLNLCFFPLNDQNPK